MASYSVRINGFARVIESSDPDQPLLYWLRGLGLTAAKFGCGLGQCGDLLSVLQIFRSVADDPVARCARPAPAPSPPPRPGEADVIIDRPSSIVAPNRNH
jgi:hypothetical protein